MITKLWSLRESSTLDSNLKNYTGVSVHPSTVRRQLRTLSLKGCVAVKKLLLTKEHKQDNLQESSGVLRTMDWPDLNTVKLV